MRALFSDHRFAAYFFARQSLLLAFSIEDVAVGWQIFALRHRALDLGWVGLILFAPQLLLALPAGVIADRYDRKVVCIACSLAEAAGLVVFIALIATQVRSVAPYFAAVALVGTAHALGVPAIRSLLATIVVNEHYIRAQALTASVGELIAIAGPAAGGALIVVGTPFAFGAAALWYALGTLAFLALPPVREHVTARAASLRDALDGVHFIFCQKTIFAAITLDLFAVLFGGATALLPVFATQILHVGATGFGVLRSAPAIGAALVAAYIARHPIKRRSGPLLLACVTGFGIATIVFGLSRNLPLSLIALAAAGGFDMVSVVIRSALVQLGTPDAMRGRVGAVENVFIGASNELGAFESGALAALIGAVPSVVAGGIATIMVIAACAFGFPSLRALDALDTPSEPA